ncbi:MAG: ATP-binding protein, partial [Nitrospirales bacterium]
TETSGLIRLTVGREGDEAVISVWDNGVGIAPELLPHIFELFTQVDGSLGRSYGHGCLQAGIYSAVEGWRDHREKAAIHPSRYVTIFHRAPLGATISHHHNAARAITFTAHNARFRRRPAPDI